MHRTDPRFESHRPLSVVGMGIVRGLLLALLLKIGTGMLGTYRIHKILETIYSLIITVINTRDQGRACHNSKRDQTDAGDALLALVRSFVRSCSSVPVRSFVAVESHPLGNQKGVGSEESLVDDGGHVLEAGHGQSVWCAPTSGRLARAAPLVYLHVEDVLRKLLTDSMLPFQWDRQQVLHSSKLPEVR